MDATLQAVIVGGAIGAVPTLGASYLAVRAQDRISRREVAAERARARATLYEELVEHLERTPFESLGASAIAGWKEGQGIPSDRDSEYERRADEWNERLHVLLARVLLHGGKEVREAARALEQSLLDAHNAAWEIAKAGKPTADPGDVAQLAVMAALLGTGWKKDADELTEAMARELDVSQ